MLMLMLMLMLLPTMSYYSCDEMSPILSSSSFIIVDGSGMCYLISIPLKDFNCYLDTSI
jgi:hypothetical protein